MEKSLFKRNRSRKRRCYHVKNSLQGRYRLCINKSNKHLSVQLIDDEKQQTLASVGTFSKAFAKTENNKKSKASAALLGETIAKMALEKEVEKVVFDRRRFKYHGLIAILADAARKSGLKF